MTKKVTPRLDFSASVPVPVYDGEGNPTRITHTSSRIAQNDLTTGKFNEYERLLLELAAALDDYEFTAMSAGSDLGSFGAATDTVRAAINQLWLHINDVSAAKFNRAGGTISGEVNVAGRVEIDGLNIEWQANTYYKTGDMVTYDHRIYRCGYSSPGATSGSTFDAEAGSWDPVGDPDHTTKLVYDPAHGFSVGEAVYYGDDGVTTGYYRALGTSIDTVPLGIVSRVHGPNSFDLTLDGFMSHTSSLGWTPNTWYYLSDETPGGLTVQEPSLPCKVVFAVSDRAGYVRIVPIAAAGQCKVDVFTATAGQTRFVLTHAAMSRYHVAITIEGVFQHLRSWTLDDNNTVVEFVEAVPEGYEVEVRYWYNVYPALGADAHVDCFTASTGTGETFTLSRPVEGKQFLNVSVSGLLIDNDEFTLAEDGSSITVTRSFGVGTSVRVQGFHTLNTTRVGAESVGYQELKPALRPRLANATRFLQYTGSLLSVPYRDYTDASSTITSGEVTTAEDIAAQLSYFNHIVLDLGSDPSGSTSAGMAADVITIAQAMGSEGDIRLFYGFIDPSSFSYDLEQIEAAIDEYYTLGFRGIMVDKLGYTDGADRTLQNGIIRKCFELNIKLILSAEDPDDLFSADAHSPGNLAGDVTAASGEAVAYLMVGPYTDGNGSVRSFENARSLIQKATGFRESNGIALMGQDLGLSETALGVRSCSRDGEAIALLAGAQAYGFNLVGTPCVCKVDHATPDAYASMLWRAGESIQWNDSGMVRCANGVTVGAVYTSGTVSVSSNVPRRAGLAAATRTEAVRSDAATLDVYVSGDPTTRSMLVGSCAGSTPPAASGTISDTGCVMTGRVFVKYSDVAEIYPGDGTSAPGDLVQLDPDEPAGCLSVTKFRGDVDLFIGIHSTDPGHILGGGGGDHPVPVALAGRVPVNIPDQFYKGDILYLDYNGAVVSIDTLVDEHVVRLPRVGKVLGFENGRTIVLI